MSILLFITFLSIFFPLASLTKLNQRLIDGEINHGKYSFLNATWLASILINGRQKCVGSLISENLVLTAGECIWGHQADEINLEIGRNNLLMDYQKDKSKIRSCIDINYPQYGSIPLVGLLFLSEPLSKNFREIQVQEPHQEDNEEPYLISMAFGPIRMEDNDRGGIMNYIFAENTKITDFCPLYSQTERGGPLLKFDPKNNLHMQYGLLGKGQNGSCILIDKDLFSFIELNILNIKKNKVSKVCDFTSCSNDQFCIKIQGQITCLPKLTNTANKTLISPKMLILIILITTILLVNLLI